MTTPLLAWPAFYTGRVVVENYTHGIWHVLLLRDPNTRRLAWGVALVRNVGLQIVGCVLETGMNEREARRAWQVLHDSMLYLVGTR